MAVCIDNKSCLKENLTYRLPSVRAKLLITLCLEIPCMYLVSQKVNRGRQTTYGTVGVKCIIYSHSKTKPQNLKFLDLTEYCLIFTSSIMPGTIMLYGVIKVSTICI